MPPVNNACWYCGAAEGIGLLQTKSRGPIPCSICERKLELRLAEERRHHQLPPPAPGAAAKEDAMPFELTVLKETDYQLPEDGPAYCDALLALLHSPSETFIRAFDFAWPGLFEEIRAADAAGIAGHILIDRREAIKPSEHALLACLVKGLKQWDVTLSSAGPGSAAPWSIEHDKALVVAPTDGGEWWCADGSANLDEAALRQANTARIFRSTLYATAFVEKFLIHRKWAWDTHPEWQITARPAVVDNP